MVDGGNETVSDFQQVRLAAVVLPCYNINS